MEELITDIRQRLNKAKMKKNNAVEEIQRQEQIFAAAQAEETAFEIALDNLVNMGKSTGQKKRRIAGQPRQANGKFGAKERHTEEEYEEYEEA